MEEFVKYDEGKIMMSLVEPEYIAETARVLTFGANKYGIENWKKCDNPRRYHDALLRHLNAYARGEICDMETGVSHLAHASCCLMFLHYFEGNQ